MGTSFTEYRGHGFWTRDAALHDVVAGHLPPPSAGFWFVDGDGWRIRPVHRP